MFRPPKFERYLLSALNRNSISNKIRHKKVQKQETWRTCSLTVKFGNRSTEKPENASKIF